MAALPAFIRFLLPLRAPLHRWRSPLAIQRHSQVTSCLNIVIVHKGAKASFSESTSQYGYTKPSPFTLSGPITLDMHLTSGNHFNHNCEPVYEMRSWLIPPKAPEMTESIVKSPCCTASENRQDISCGHYSPENTRDPLGISTCVFNCASYKSSPTGEAWLSLLQTEKQHWRTYRSMLGRHQDQLHLIWDNLSALYWNKNLLGTLEQNAFWSSNHTSPSRLHVGCRFNLTLLQRHQQEQGHP